MIKLEIALIKVSILLIVKEIESNIKIIEILRDSFFNNIEKKAKSGLTELLIDTATKPLNPKKNTIGITIKNEINKLLFSVLLSLAA